MSNPLQKLINRYLSEHQLSKSSFIKQLGFSNINKGARRLSAFIENPDDKNPLFNKIISVADIPESEFELACSAVQDGLENQRRLEFIPMVRVIPKRRPSPLFGLIMYNIRVPEGITELDFDEEIRIICNLYQEFKIKYPSAQGFRYFRSYDETLEFDIEGKLIQ